MRYCIPDRGLGILHILHNVATFSSTTASK
jgi:hypothetical protein